MSEFKVRRYQKSDLKEVLKLHILALKSADAYAKSGPWDEDLKNIEKVYIKKGGEFLVGILNKKIIAMGALKRISDDISEIKRMRVHPDFQRKGYGQLILDHLENKAKNLGYKKIQMDTTIKQTAAQNLYKKNKYQKYKVGYIGPYKSIFYRKKIKQLK